MGSRTLYLIAIALFAVSALLGTQHEDSYILMLPAGACIVAAAALNRGPGRFKERPGELWTKQPPFLRGCAVFIGVIWAVIGIHAVVT